MLVATADGQMFALDAATGEPIWQHAGLFEQAGLLGGASPAVANGLVIAAYASGEVVALSLENGQQLWSDTVLRPRRTLAIGTIADIVGDPVIAGDRVFVAGVSGEMAAFDLERGVREWTAEVTSIQTPWVAGNFIFILTERNEVVCMVDQGGRIRWVTPLATLVEPEDPDSRQFAGRGRSGQRPPAARELRGRGREHLAVHRRDAGNRRDRRCGNRAGCGRRRHGVLPHRRRPAGRVPVTR